MIMYTYFIIIFVQRVDCVAMWWTLLTINMGLLDHPLGSNRIHTIRIKTILSRTELANTDHIIFISIETDAREKPKVPTVQIHKIRSSNLMCKQ